MKRFHIQEKAFSFGGKYIITDEIGYEVYIAKGTPFSFSKHNSIFDSFGTKVYEFKKELFSWKQVYFILKDEKPVFKLFKNRISLPPEIFIESLTDAEAFYVQGDFWGRNYTFKEGNQIIAFVTKKFTAFRDQYDIKIEEGYDECLILTVVLIIDKMKEKKKK